MALYTKDELDAEIIQYKRAISALSRAKEYSSGNFRVVRSELPELRAHLEWLGKQHDALEAGGSSGGVIVQGGVRR